MPVVQLIRSEPQRLCKKYSSNCGTDAALNNWPTVWNKQVLISKPVCILNSAVVCQFLICQKLQEQSLPGHLDVVQVDSRITIFPSYTHRRQLGNNNCWIDRKNVKFLLYDRILWKKSSPTRHEHSNDNCHEKSTAMKTMCSTKYLKKQTKELQTRFLQVIKLTLTTHH